MTEATTLAAAAADRDPRVGLRAVAALRRLLEQLERVQVAGARAQGWSWQDIASELGVSRQAVHKKHAEADVFKRFTTDSREVVRGALEEAQRVDSPVVGTEHLLLALAAAGSRPAAALAAAGVDRDGLDEVLGEAGRAARRGGLDQADAEALATLGVDVDAIVEGIEREHGEGALVPPAPRRLLGRAPARHRPFTPDAKRVLERALRAAVAADAGEITAEHVLLGLAGGDDVVARALTDRGAGPGELSSWFATNPR